MKNIKPSQLSEILHSFCNKRILVLGDVMLDEYLWGKVQRISPEAPVPIVEIDHEEYRLGGAANVALNLISLGAKVELVGVCGKDSQAKTLKKLLKQNKLNTAGLFEDGDRPTTLKTRIGASNQQIVRIDKENTQELRIDLSEEICAYLERLMPVCDALIVEDYDKGLLSYKLINEVLHLARKNQIIVAVDPKQRSYDCYGGVDIFKPNYAELQANCKKTFASEAEFFESASESRNLMKTKHLVVTHGAKGMFIFSGKATPKHIPSFAREVFDVSGAGDTVISALTLAYLFDNNIESAALIANHAAAVVVAKHGTACTSIAEIAESFDDFNQTL